MKTIVTRGGKLIVANVRQPKTDAKWQGEAEDGATATGDTMEECRDNLCDGSEATGYTHDTRPIRGVRLVNIERAA